MRRSGTARWKRRLRRARTDDLDCHKDGPRGHVVCRSTDDHVVALALRSLRGCSLISSFTVLPFRMAPNNSMAPPPLRFATHPERTGDLRPIPASQGVGRTRACHFTVSEVDREHWGPARSPWGSTGEEESGRNGRGREERGLGVVQEPRRNALPVFVKIAAVPGCTPVHGSPGALPLLKTGERTWPQPPPRGCKDSSRRLLPGKLRRRSTPAA